ncbi:MAG: group 1 truncated hemoglobin [Methylophilaceae bacterium]|nr:group 1 truncated hemoglobin [Methylophilaceae bacterium]MDG1453531.1 group 1 truncated hemoglobin [Methylophilaceae bacterium]
MIHLTNSNKFISLIVGFTSFLMFTFTSAATAEEEESLYQRLGGTYNIASTVDYLVDMIYINNGLNANPSLKAVHDRKETKAGFKAMLTNWVVQETGGPKIYQPDPFGRGKTMKDSHPHLNISNREFDIIKTLCLATFYQFNVGNHEIDQLMDDLESYRKVIVTRKDEAPFTSRLKKDGVEYRTK